MFALCQALPAPGSTKIIYAPDLIHGGLIADMLSFFIGRYSLALVGHPGMHDLNTHSLPGDIAAYGLAVGVSNIDHTLPAPVHSLLSGLNASTVGIIALAAVRLSQKTITDNLTRTLVFLGGSAGMLYDALWYFPVLVVLGGLVTIVWDCRWGRNAVRAVKGSIFGPRNRSTDHSEKEQAREEAEIQVVA